MSLITPDLIALLRDHFRLDWHGIHGSAHWARVRLNGLHLAPLTGANPRVVEYFAFLHDACRQDDCTDAGHGLRAADFVRGLQHRLVLTVAELEELATACTLHSNGLTQGYSATILTCWDADRLDLGRVGVRPDPRYLCTAAAKAGEVVEWAYRRSIGS